jgi:hypothetical protein
MYSWLEQSGGPRINLSSPVNRVYPVANVLQWRALIFTCYLGLTIAIARELRTAEQKHISLIRNPFLEKGVQTNSNFRTSVRKLLTVESHQLVANGTIIVAIFLYAHTSERDPDVKAYVKIVNSQSADGDLQDCSVPDHRRDPNIDNLFLFDHGLSPTIATGKEPILSGTTA